jgi:competence protein ComEC
MQEVRSDPTKDARSFHFMESLWRILVDLYQKIPAQRGTLFLWCPVFMGLGIAFYFSLKTEPSLVYGWAGVAGLSSLLLVVRHRQIARIFVVLALMVTLGFTAAGLRTQSGYTPILAREMQPVSVRGTIEQLENLDSDKHMRVILTDVEIEKLKPGQTPRKVRLKLRGGHDLRIGQRIEVLAGLNPPSAPNMPGGFDFQRHSYFLGLGALGFAYKEAVVVQDHTPSNYSQFIENMRRKIAQTITDEISLRQASIANALITGPRAAISEEDNEAIRASGLAHMLSISGLHITMVFGTVFFFVRAILALFPAFALNHPIKKYAALAGMLAAIFYTLISGGSVPTQRSILMSGIVFFAILVDRTPFSMRVIAFAALVVLLFFPDSLLGASFQMSFAAVAALIGFYEAARPILQKLKSKAGIVRRVFLFVLGICLTSAIATFITAPYTLYHFQQLPLYSILANVLAVPVLSFIVMPAAIVMFLFMPFGLEWIPLWFIGFGVDLILDIAHFVASIEHSVYRTAQWPPMALYLFTAAFLVVLIAKGAVRLVALLPLGLFFVVIAQAQKPNILISEDGKLIAAKLSSGDYAVNTMRAERFVRENWARALGQPTEAFVKWPQEGRLENLSCDSAACRLEQGVHKISFLRVDHVLPEECAWADIVIVMNSDYACKAPIVVTRRALKQGGAHSFVLDNEEIVFSRSQDKRGLRPWNAEYQKKLWRESFEKEDQAISDKSVEG